MLINFPNQLTSEEEQLLKKIAKMKKKKKTFIEKKAQIKESQAESQQNITSSSTVSGSAAIKRSNSNISKKPEIDAKEAAKKLIQSGAIKLETESKSKGFKRSCSRKDDIKKNNPNNIVQESQSTANQQITYSSINSPNNTKSPNVFNGSPNYNNNRFTYSTAGENNYGQSPNYNRHYRRMNSFNADGPSGPSQGPTPGNGMPNFRFQKRPNQQFNNNFQQKNGISLFIKANNVTEELLRSIFNANLSQIKILSIDVKTNFAFVSVETKEAADTTIMELNGKTFQDNLFSVSIARPRKQFQRNNSYNPGGGSNYNNHNNNYGPKNTYNSGGQNNFNNNNNNRNNYGSNNTFNNNNNNNKSENNHSNAYSYGDNTSDASISPNMNNSQNTSGSSRQMINYEDI